jgi:hypothetical protein
MDIEALARDVRIYVFRHAVETANVPQAEQIALELGHSKEQIHEALKYLASSKVLILAPNNGNIWAANPFCAVPSGFRVTAGGKKYWGICIWDSLGIAAAVGKDAQIDATCGDCGDPIQLEIRNSQVSPAEGIVHFAVPATRWWENIGYT